MAACTIKCAGERGVNDWFDTLHVCYVSKGDHKWLTRLPLTSSYAQIINA